MTGLALTGMRRPCLTMLPTRRRRITTHGSRSIPVVPCTCSLPSRWVVSPNSRTSPGETIELSAPVSTGRWNGPSPSMRTATTIRSAGPGRAGAANGSGAGGGALIAPAATDSPSRAHDATAQNMRDRALTTDLTVDTGAPWSRAVCAEAPAGEARCATQLVPPPARHPPDCASAHRGEDSCGRAPDTGPQLGASAGKNRIRRFIAGPWTVR